jgi:predicted RNase H-like HicB family nuclease
VVTFFEEKDLHEIHQWADGKPYECLVYICPDETGGFFAYAANLPGVVSQGETEEETIESIKEAFRGAIATYRESGEIIPWTSEVDPLPEKALEKRIVVHA